MRHVRVTFSNYHQGQMIEPKIEAKHVGGEFYEVTLQWINKAGGEPRPSSFTGTERGCEDWLVSRGVRAPSVNAA